MAPPRLELVWLQPTTQVLTEIPDGLVFESTGGEGTHGL
jgi:hypothetical protein